MAMQYPTMRIILNNQIIEESGPPELFNRADENGYITINCQHQAIAFCDRIVIRNDSTGKEIYSYDLNKIISITIATPYDHYIKSLKCKFYNVCSGCINKLESTENRKKLKNKLKKCKQKCSNNLINKTKMFVEEYYLCELIKPTEKEISDFIAKKIMTEKIYDMPLGDGKNLSSEICSFL